ncbi:hypothetical protein BD309DRAFT_987021 [Dichomitus squalens]|uniref:Uncharacterized protein n=2 Tax=Dichomitus squalens TaxID=114155 RepID=A0A4Q9P523_9APHY|nr:uncharacterized protein DICSQDRAFT_171500 [Dichomitus squalens LYAD-421 SS1]EJF60013.1 hypothetical protein DICSQDRAFT_171500 [Dichomitus squalens LYAD-421 SS1]TBU29205.1 hypothetical protein BD311DRAFT_661794 [Dichomitus squalens]TBU48755.1 hypothetical protein BD309DRAFT_987021 [Dichomitus squalens]TBU57807.1 hypothetical protein BD310DRAFT_977825 [Dichomitus squalens]
MPTCLPFSFLKRRKSQSPKVKIPQGSIERKPGVSIVVENGERSRKTVVGTHIASSIFAFTSFVFAFAFELLVIFLVCLFISFLLGAVSLYFSSSNGAFAISWCLSFTPVIASYSPAIVILSSQAGN